MQLGAIAAAAGQQESVGNSGSTITWWQIVLPVFAALLVAFVGAAALLRNGSQQRANDRHVALQDRRINASSELANALSRAMLALDSHSSQRRGGLVAVDADPPAEWLAQNHEAWDYLALARERVSTVALLFGVDSLVLHAAGDSISAVQEAYRQGSQVLFMLRQHEGLTGESLQVAWKALDAKDRDFDAARRAGSDAMAVFSSRVLERLEGTAVAKRVAESSAGLS